MRLLVFDPGQTTGYALVKVTDTPTVTNVQFKVVDEFTDLLEFQRIAPELFGGWIDIVVIEDYIIYPNRAASHAGSKVLTARTIGHIEFATIQFGARRIPPGHPEIVFQTASMAKNRWPNKRLTKYIGRFSHLSPHKIDAVRHAFTYVERKFNKTIVVVT